MIDTFPWGDPDFHAAGRPVWFRFPERTTIAPARPLLWPAALRINRYVGQYGPVNLAEHTALVAWLAHEETADPVLRGLAALHDWHEVIVGDVPAGLKKHLPDFRAIETAWAGHFHRSLGYGWPLTDEQESSVKRWDRRALAIEMARFSHPLATVTAEETGGRLTEAERQLGKRVFGYQTRGRFGHVIEVVDRGAIILAERGAT